MNKPAIILCTISLFFIGIFMAAGQGTNTNSQLKNRIDTYATAGVEHGFSGAFLVSVKGEVLLNKGYGMAHKEKQILNSPSTIFDIGSNTKQFTGAAILTLVAQEKLKVTDSLNQYFEDLPGDKQYITIHQLLTHSAGFQESIGRDFEHMATEDFFDKVFASDLKHFPGKQYSYSNIGYSVLARIIELVSTESYEAFLSKNLFTPAGMHQTGYLLPQWNSELLAKGYNRNVMDMGATVSRYLEDGKVSWHLKGNGGINSSPEDMYKWYQALKNNTVLTKALFETYTTSYVGDVHESFGYAYGWGITNSDRNTKRITHNGSNGAFAHTIIWLPEEDVIILYATNAGSPKVERLAYAVEKMIFDPTHTPNPIAKNPYFLVMDFVEKNEVTESGKLLDLIKNKYKEDFDRPGVLNRLGYMILRADKHPSWAVEVFRMNTSLFENDGNAWDSLGDGYIAIGQKEKAIESFKKAIALNNEGTAEKLEKLLQKN